MTTVLALTLALLAPQALQRDRAPAPKVPDHIADPHQGGQAAGLRLVDLRWGRLVDVHDLDGSGATRVRPVYAQTVVNDAIQSDGVNYLLETNPVTQATRLVILREEGAPPPTPGAGTFADLFQLATANLPVIVPKNDDGSSPPPFSLVPRNATVVMRFDDLLADGPAARQALAQTVKVLTGYPPVVPFSARVLFDRNYGGVARGCFHSTRVLIDLTVSELEAQSSPFPLPVNLLGAPASEPTSSDPNLSIRIPSQLSFPTGQFVLLRNLAGNPLATTGNGPVDLGSPTLDVVRAARTGNATDAHNGFLLDLEPPRLLAAWPATLDAAANLVGGQLGFDYLVDLTLTTVCRRDLRLGDVIEAGTRSLEVLGTGAPIDPSGKVVGARVRYSGSTPLPRPGVLLGNALVATPYDGGVGPPDACWLAFSPQPGTLPATGVSSLAQTQARFSEPMDPASLDPFDGFQVIRGSASASPGASNTVVAAVAAASDLRAFAHVPQLPLDHMSGVAEVYHVRLAGAVDLAGNALGTPPPPIEFTLDPGAASLATGNLALRFSALDEYQLGAAAGVPDVRGQVLYDLGAGELLPRAVTRFSAAADRSNPVPGLMIPFPPGVQTPLSPLGSKLHTVWRYCDLGWLIDDESKHNVDVEGLSWAPVGGLVIADLFAQFEIRLAHAARLPDEYLSSLTLLPVHPASGLVGRSGFYADNVLADPVGAQQVVHPRAAGYFVNPTDLFVNASGTPLMPFPLNRTGAPYAAYTWRDTAVLAQGGPSGAGTPLDIEVQPPLQLYGPGASAGQFDPPGQVRSVGLPLLMEFRCFPDPGAIGLNALDISLAINSSARPSFRSFSTGGINQLGQVVTKDPDLELVPSGGFNPFSTPPGLPTVRAADNSYYVGQAELVTRLSRAHTIWFDSQSASPDYVQPVLDPMLLGLPAGTSIAVDFRGADGFVGGAGTEPFDATQLDAYGEPPAGVAVLFHGGVATWSSSIDSVDGARYLQARLTFAGDVATGLRPTLSAFGLSWTR